MTFECMGECCRPVDVPTHPVQTKRVIHRPARCPQAVTMRAYEVYCSVFKGIYVFNSLFHKIPSTFLLT